MKLSIEKLGFLGQGRSQIAMSLGNIGVSLQRPVVIVNRYIELAAIVQREGQSVEQISIVGTARQGLPQMGVRLVNCPPDISASPSARFTCPFSELAA